MDWFHGQFLGTNFVTDHRYRFRWNITFRISWPKHLEFGYVLFHKTISNPIPFVASHVSPRSRSMASGWIRTRLMNMKSKTATRPKRKDSFKWCAKMHVVYTGTCKNHTRSIPHFDISGQGCWQSCALRTSPNDTSMFTWSRARIPTHGLRMLIRRMLEWSNEGRCTRGIYTMAL